MTPLYAAAIEVQDLCCAYDWAFCFIGGVAVQRWGELRYTEDVDLTLCTGFGREQAFVNALLSHFQPRLGGAAAFALRSRVVLAQASNGVPLDIALGAVPFEARAAGPVLEVLTRALLRDVFGVSAEARRHSDGIVRIAYAARPLAEPRVSPAGASAYGRVREA